MKSNDFQNLLNNFQLKQLFIEELGWDNGTTHPKTVEVSGEHFVLTTIAQKRGVSVFQCSPDREGNVPARPILLKIEKEAAKIAYEHLLIFANTAQTTLTWLWVARTPNQPTATRTHTWHKGTSGESLRQKLNQIVWALDQEHAITLTDVITGLRKAFDRDKVSKSFYEKFKTEHKIFSEFIQGFEKIADQTWYASLMLNRLMFVYFIQRKGFLDGDANYLVNKMQRVRREAGEDQFHSFYRLFLCRLFHEGLGLASREDKSLFQLLGNVPYLNGGLFAVHELEENNPDIDIPDAAFERLFGFFDAYDWHLDDRPLSKGTEINPDVLGYIFEKYINQKQMGAYYTKEDITEYISKNTVIPHLLEQTRERCKVAFDGETSIWHQLQDFPSRYLYPAMKTGVIDGNGQIVPESALPDFVQIGMNDPNARMFDRRYNLSEAQFHTATGERGTLPTETWREYIARRTRCLALYEKLNAGGITHTDDLITHNLDIRQFMQDVIDNCTSPDLLRAIWQSIVGRVPEKSHEKFHHGITILDPTCGSGAFLFAALNVLEPLYEACLDRMEGFVEDALRPSSSSKNKRNEHALPDFQKVLEEVAHHHSRRYFIYKNIILHNLFGVDIMAEAVEICKLRLFLKLVSQVEGGRDLEPLPDIDFNICTGNTLVGYATEAQFDATHTLASDQTQRDEIKASTADLADGFEFFRTQQTVHDGKITRDDKQKLREKLKNLSLKLDRYLAHDYGIDPDKPSSFEAWRASHQPFHWFAEFYGVMRTGGFDVVIGNPPYVAKTKITSYSLRGFQTQSATDIYAWCLERSSALLNSTGYTGMIVPLSLAFSGDFYDVRKLIYKAYQRNWVSSFSNRPSKLFNGVEVRCAIQLSTKSGTKMSQTTRLHRWYGSARESLFSTLYYSHYNPELWGYQYPKLPTAMLIRQFEKCFLSNQMLGEAVSRRATKFFLCFKKSGRNWLSFGYSHPPAYGIAGAPIEQNEFGIVYFVSELARDLSLLLLNGKIAFTFWIAVGDDFHLTKGNFAGLPLSLSSLSESDTLQLKNLVEPMKNALEKSVTYMTMHGKSLGNYNLTKCRHVTDKSDVIFARAFGFDKVWDDVELLFSQTVRTDSSVEDE